MKQLTLKQINEEIKSLGYELVKVGRDYFYFRPITTEVNDLYSSSVAAVSVNQFTLELWVSDLKEKIADTKRRRGEEEEQMGRYPNGYEGYKNKLPYPTEEYRYVIYSKGATVCDTTDVEEFKLKQKDYPGAPFEKFRINEDVYRAKMQEYREEEGRLRDLFIQDLFEYHGVQNNPLKDIAYAKAYDSGHHAGYSEIASHFSDLVEIIDRAKNVEMAKLIRDMREMFWGAITPEMDTRIATVLTDAGFPDVIKKK